MFNRLLMANEADWDQLLAEGIRETHTVTFPDILSKCFALYQKCPFWMLARFQRQRYCCEEAWWWLCNLNSHIGPVCVSCVNAEGLCVASALRRTATVCEDFFVGLFLPKKRVMFNVCHGQLHFIYFFLSLYTVFFEASLYFL